MTFNEYEIAVGDDENILELNNGCMNQVLLRG